MDFWNETFWESVLVLAMLIALVILLGKARQRAKRLAALRADFARTRGLDVDEQGEYGTTLRGVVGAATVEIYSAGADVHWGDDPPRSDAKATYAEAQPKTPTAPPGNFRLVNREFTRWFVATKSGASAQAGLGDQAFDARYAVQLDQVALAQRVLDATARALLIALAPQTMDLWYRDGHVRLHLLGTDQNAEHLGQACDVVCRIAAGSS